MQQSAAAAGQDVAGLQDCTPTGAYVLVKGVSHPSRMTASAYNSVTLPPSTSQERSNRTFCNIRRSWVTNSSAPS